ncbi:MAG: type II toxin-antitoxin system RelE/ParE family toxin [Prevotella sp.]|nr:type II toxin-antitoxin system RelE/ParE family toxin [Prevotella sp.]
MQVKYNKKASQHISSTIDYYLENFGTQATVNLAHEIDEKIKTLRKYPEIGFPEPLLRDRYILYRATHIGKYHKLIYYVRGKTLRVAAFWDMRMRPDKLTKMV